MRKGTSYKYAATFILISLNSIQFKNFLLRFQLVKHLQLSYFNLCSFKYIHIPSFEFVVMTSCPIFSVRPCKVNSCHNGGTCLQRGIIRELCVCPKGYDGFFCQMEGMNCVSYYILIKYPLVRTNHSSSIPTT